MHKERHLTNDYENDHDNLDIDKSYKRNQVEQKEKTNKENVIEPYRNEYLFYK